MADYLTESEQKLRKLAESSADVWGEPIGACRTVLKLLESLANAREELASQRDSYSRYMELRQRADAAEKRAAELESRHSEVNEAAKELRRLHREGDAKLAEFKLLLDVGLAQSEARIAELQSKYARLVAMVERRGFIVTENEVRLVDDDLAAQRNKIARLETENERLREAAKPLVWSKEPPSKAGLDHCPIPEPQEESDA